jgi:integrase
LEDRTVLPNRIPAYTLHRASGQAVVRVDGRDVYLGKHGTAASKAAYDRTIAEWLARGRRLSADPESITVAELVNAYRRHAEQYYQNADEACGIKLAMKPLLKLYARVAAFELGPLAIHAVQQEMIGLGWCRSFCNQQLGRIKRMFKWGARQELVPAELFHRLSIVSGLLRGRCAARETDPVKPVAVEHVDAIRPWVPTQVWAMVQLQLLTGMRPAEVCMMRGCDIEMKRSLWVYRPPRHKTAHHGHDRQIYLGPRARAVIEPFLQPNTTAYIFDPYEAVLERRAARRQRRRTPMRLNHAPNGCSHAKREAGAAYSSDSYRRCIARACDRADVWAKGAMVVADDERVVPRWHPNQLRHTAATELRKSHGLEAAQVILGHKTLTVTQVYAERNVQQAMRVMAAVG